MQTTGEAVGAGVAGLIVGADVGKLELHTSQVMSSQWVFSMATFLFPYQSTKKRISS